MKVPSDNGQASIASLPYASCPARSQTKLLALSRRPMRGTLPSGCLPLLPAHEMTSRSQAVEVSMGEVEGCEIYSAGCPFRKRDPSSRLYQ